MLRGYPLILHRLPNSGLNAARAAGFAIAQGRWISFCDDDGLWKPHYLQTMLSQMNGPIGVGFANHQYVRNEVWSQQTKLDRAPPGYFETISDPFYPHLLRWVPMVPSTTI